MSTSYELKFFTDVIDWIDGLRGTDRESYHSVIAALEHLRDVGPGLRRPTVGAVEGSQYRNMRELRPRSGSRMSIRILFAFDPRSRAVFLIAGNKAASSKWDRWYPAAIKEADERYAAWLEQIELETKEGKR